jgi:5-methylcytosine-specific restriction endonuclease McrA
MGQGIVRKGTCVFCMTPVLSQRGLPTQRHWHGSCAFVWSIMNNPTAARQVVFLRDLGTCARCRTRCTPLPDVIRLRSVIAKAVGAGTATFKPLPHLHLGEWELDHITPLWRAQSGGDRDLWKLANMQTLCPTCHIHKTASDMGAMHKYRRGLKEN